MSLGQNKSKNAIENWNTRTLSKYETLKLSPLSPALGAEVEGIDLRQPLSEDALAEIKTAISEHLVLVFRNQAISPEDHKRFARYFGTLHQHKLSGDYKDTSQVKTDPEILAWKTGKESNYTAGEAWHSDVTCDEEPIWGSFLRLTRQPEIGGGDTAFANLYLAYDLLSDPIKNLLADLTAIHDGAHAWTRGYGISPKPGQTFPVSEHPIIAKHPFSGRPFLFVNSGFTSRIPQLNRLESDALLQFLFQHIEKSLIIQNRIRWSADTLVFWDNWATQHHAVWDYYPFDRWGERVSAFIGSSPQQYRV